MSDQPPRTVAGVPWWVWAVGVVGALVVMGPALAPGPLLNLDLVAVERPPVPRGVWGLGPELPRRVPMWVPIAWLAPVFGGANLTKAVMVLGLVVAFAGMYRFVRVGNQLVAVGAAALYAFNPFILTRLAVGHLNMVWTAALLPWAVADLLAPDRSLRRTFLWSAAFGLTGNFGGAIAGLVVGVGLVQRRGRRAPAVLGAFVLAQLPWLATLLVVNAVSAPELADAGAFPTTMAGLSGVGELLAGHGFWNPPFQVGWPAAGYVAVVGFALLALAAVGTLDLPRDSQRALVALAAAGFVASAATAIPGLDELTARVSRSAVGAPFRESQRLLVLYLLWLAPAAALGARRLAAAVPIPEPRAALAGAARGVLMALPLVAAIPLAAPGAWGVGGQLRPTPFPDDWHRARDVVSAEPGTLVAFPWYQYFTFDVAQNRLVLNTAPLFFGGDVIVSSNPGIGSGRSGGAPRERGDRREARVELLVGRLKAGGHIARDLTDLGVRWVVLMKDVDWPRYEPGLGDDPGLERVLDGEEIVLFRVRDWHGLVATPDGESVGASPVLAPVLSVEASGPARVALPATAGWRRGLDPASVAPDGLLMIPEGDGPVWFWPAVVVVIADTVWLGCVVFAFRGRKSRGSDADRQILHNDGKILNSSRSGPI